MPMHSLPSSLVWSEYSYAPSSTRATSLSRTIFPPGSFFMTMFSNSSGVSRRPWVFIMSSYAASRLERGSWFSFPAATCLFCSLSAAATCDGVMSTCASLSGSSHMRMEYWRSP